MKDYVHIGALVASAILFGMFVYLIFNDANPNQYITIAVMLVFAVLATRLGDITNLNFGATGVRAELERKLREAQATVAQLQRIAELFGQISVQQISSGNRWGGLSSREKREAIGRIKQGLEAIDLADDRIEKVLLTQRNYDRFDYYYWVTVALPANPTQNEIVAFASFHNSFPNASLEAVPSISEVEEYLKQNGVTTGEAIERLKDWRQYERDRTHRRLDLWDQRHS